MAAATEEVIMEVATEIGMVPGPIVARPRAIDRIQTGINRRHRCNNGCSSAPAAVLITHRTAAFASIAASVSDRPRRRALSATRRSRRTPGFVRRAVRRSLQQILRESDFCRPAETDRQLGCVEHWIRAAGGQRYRSWRAPKTDRIMRRSRGLYRRASCVVL